MNDIFGPGSNLEKRIVRDYTDLVRKIEACREIGMKIVYTAGTFDMFHVGHARYLEKAKNSADIDLHNVVLIVGVDSDEKVRRRKGKNRPIVPEDERMEIVAHARHVDLVVFKNPDDPKWHLVDLIKPDVFVKSRSTKETADSVTDDSVVELEKICGKVVVLDPQATTSTTARLRVLIIENIEKIKTEFLKFSKTFTDLLEKIGGGNEQ